MSLKPFATVFFFSALLLSGCAGSPESEIKVYRIANQKAAPSSDIKVPLLSNHIELGLLNNFKPQIKTKYGCPKGVFYVNIPRPTPLVVEKFPQECWSYMIVNSGIQIISVPSKDHF